MLAGWRLLKSFIWGKPCLFHNLTALYNVSVLRNVRTAWSSWLNSSTRGRGRVCSAVRCRRGFSKLSGPRIYCSWKTEMFTTKIISLLFENSLEKTWWEEEKFYHHQGLLINMFFIQEQAVLYIASLLTGCRSWLKLTKRADWDLRSVAW